MKRILAAAFFLLCWGMTFAFQACSRRIPTVPPPLPPTPTPTLTCGFYAAVNLTGNLNSAQAAAQPGGLLNLAPAGSTLLPLSFVALGGPNFFNTTKFQPVLFAVNGLAISQVSDLTAPVDPTNPLPHHTSPLLNGGAYWTGPLGSISGLAYGWGPPAAITPACSAVKTILDGAGNSRQITFQFYQVNDLGAGGVNPGPNNQAAWAWYAFETTGGAPISNAALVGGSGVEESVPTLACSSDRGIPNYLFSGDLLCFNSDGSLASEGAMGGPTGPNLGYQVKPNLYLPAYNGAVITRVSVNFGTAGLLGFGLRDGITGDAAASSVQ